MCSLLGEEVKEVGRSRAFSHEHVRDLPNGPVSQQLSQWSVTFHTPFFHSIFGFFFFFLLPQHFFDSFPNTSSSHLSSVALRSVFVSALAYGSGFGSVTRWFQLLEVRISDREGIRPP